MEKPINQSIRAKIHHRFSSQSQFQLAIDVELPTQGITAIFGHSGSGKTTLLRCIAGLERVLNSEITFKNEQWQTGEQFLPTHQRSVGYVFQEASLFPHLTVQQNLQFAIKRARQSDSPIIRFEEAISLLGIESLMGHYSAQLSGGERQRVAIARALLSNPKLLLMDEPLSALDYQRKQDILPYLESLKHELNIPIIYVSHSLSEVTRLADHLVVLEKGEVQLEGKLADCLTSLQHPLAPGDEPSVVLEGQIDKIDQPYQQAGIEFSAGTLWFHNQQPMINSTARVRILARDVSLSLSHHTDTSINNIFPATVIDFELIDNQANALVRLKVGNEIIISKITRRSLERLSVQREQQIWAQIKAVALVH